MPLFSESLITINGVTLDNRMSMTIRVALESFATDLWYNGLGDDPHGKIILDLYMKRINEIRSIMYGPNWKEGNNNGVVVEIQKPK